MATTHNPKALVVNVRHAGIAVAGCEVLWETSAGHGWVFPTTRVTNSDGQVRAFWTAGDQGNQVARARMTIEGAGDQTLTFTGLATPSPRTRTDSIHIGYEAPPWTQLKVQVTPVTGPQSTYYSTANWPGAYGGIQFDENAGVRRSLVIFSVWDIDAARKAEIRNTGVCNYVSGFGGEGTGTTCALRFPPATYGAIAGLPADYNLKAGDTYETHVAVSHPPDCPTCSDYSFSFTDVTRGLGPISLGVQRYKERVTPSYAGGFVEDWLDGPGDHCLNAGTRTAYFHNIQVFTTAWQPVNRASFGRVYLPANHEICSNYYFGVSNNRFLMSSGGSDLISRPVVDGDPEFGQAPALGW